MIKKMGLLQDGGSSDHTVATAAIFLPYKIAVYILQTYTLPIQYQIPHGGLLNVLWGTVCPGGQSMVVVPPGRHLGSQKHCVYFHVFSTSS